MNILFFQNLANPNTGGVQKVSFEIAKELMKRNINCYLLIRKKDSYVPPVDIFLNTCCILRNSDNEAECLSSLVSSWNISIIINQCAECRKDIKLLSQIKKNIPLKIYSFLHISPMNTRNSFNAHRDMRFPRLVVRSLLKKLFFVFYPIDKYRYKYCYEHSDKVIFLSPKFIPEFEQIIDMKVCERRVASIPNMLSFDGCLHDTNEKKKVVLFVGRLEEIDKRVSKIIDVWRLSYSKIPDWKLIILGDGRYRKKYEKLALRYKLKNIFFEGFRDPFDYYKYASILLLTSVAEGFPLSVLEALQMGCIPIAFNSYSSITDLISHNRNGILVRDGDVGSMSKALIDLAKDEKRRYDMGQQGMNSIEKFERKRIVDLWIQLLYDV